MYKLQISCIIIMLFLFVLFVTERNFKRETQKLFSLILIVSVFQVLFEVLIIYTIQNMETVSPILFKSVHRSYLILVLTFFYLNFRYMSSFIKEEVGEPAKSLGFIHVAQVILYAGIFLLPLGYEKTEKAVEFTYGPGVWIVYVGAAFYMFIIFSNYCGRSRRIAAEKILPLVFGVGIGMCACFYYMLVPSSYVSCLGVAIMNIAFFLSLRCPEQCHECDGYSETGSEKDGAQTYSCVVSFEAPQARVLLVDDSEMNRKVAYNLLKKTKMQIDEAGGGKECLELVKKNTYQMIFLDHLMPEMDGLETFDILKRQKLIEEIPVIVMTANTVSMSEKDYLDYGFAAYVSKPILPEKLGSVVYELLDKSLVTAVEKKEVACADVAEKDKNAEQIPEPDAVQEQNWDKLPVVDGVDYNYAALHFQNTSEYEEMVRFLVAVMKPDMQEIQAYYEKPEDEENLQKFQTKVHSMKNSAMTIGVVPLAGLAKTLEDAVRERNKEQIQALMPVFTEKWEKYRHLLHEAFGGSEADKVLADPDSEEIKTLFKRLREAAAEMDIDELDEIMEEIGGYAFDPKHEEKIQKIRLAVLNFEVEYLQEEGYL